MAVDRLGRSRLVLARVFKCVRVARERRVSLARKHRARVENPCHEEATWWRKGRKGRFQSAARRAGPLPGRRELSERVVEVPSRFCRRRPPRLPQPWRATWPVLPLPFRCGFTLVELLVVILILVLAI